MSLQRLLLVDDDQDFCQELIVAFENAYDLVIAHTKADALKKMRNSNFHLVLLDLFLENVMKEGSPDGFEFISEIRNINRTIPIIIVSKLDDARVTRAAFKDYEAQDFFFKGGDFVKLHESIQSIINPFKEPLVFISYSTKDDKFVDLFLEKLSKYHIRCWIDKKEINAGQRLNSKIAQGISEASHYLVIISKNSVDSKWVKKEMIFADMKEKPIIPIIYEDVDIPLDLELIMGDSHRIFFRDLFESQIKSILDFINQPDQISFE